MQRIEMKIFVDVDENIDLTEFENNFYHLDSLGQFFVDVARVDIIDVEKI